MYFSKINLLKISKITFIIINKIKKTTRNGLGNGTSNKKATRAPLMLITGELK